MGSLAQVWTDDSTEVWWLVLVQVLVSPFSTSYENLSIGNLEFLIMFLVP
jgi:hypothetical protein